MTSTAGHAGSTANWVSATLKPLPGHSVADLERVLARAKSGHAEEIYPGVLLFEGDEELLDSLESMAFVYLNVSHSFSPEYD